jgi:hypothetical protein
MSLIKNKERLKQKMKYLLISAGLEGLSQTDIIAKCRTHHTKVNPTGFTGQDIREVLSDWKLRGLAQRFDVRQGFAKKLTRIWRATNSIKVANL